MNEIALKTYSLLRVVLPTRVRLKVSMELGYVRAMAWVEEDIMKSYFAEGHLHWDEARFESARRIFALGMMNEVVRVLERMDEAMIDRGYIHTRAYCGDLTW